MRVGDYVMPRGAGLGEDRFAQIVGVSMPHADPGQVIMFEVKHVGTNFPVETYPHELRLATVSEVLRWKQRHQIR